MKHVPWAVCFSSHTKMAGCGLFVSEETRYLMSAGNHATQAEVVENLGKPIESKGMAAGNFIRIYQVRALQSGNHRVALVEWCDEYTLVFDNQGTLRD